MDRPIHILPRTYRLSKFARAHNLSESCEMEWHQIAGQHFDCGICRGSLSGDIAGDVRSRYNYLRKFGPNDGLTLLADELMPGGITIVEPGFDHFYRDPDINLKSLAIANLVAEKLTIRSSLRK